MEQVWIVGTAILLDWIFGDPYWLPHPVRAVGWIIRQFESRVIHLKCHAKFQGILLWIGVLGTVSAVVWGGLAVLEEIHPWMRRLTEVLLIYTALAARCLDAETTKVQQALEEGDLQQARKLLSYLVGRDTEHLNEQEVIRAAVETIAENTSDGVIAPLFFALLGGAPLALMYKAVNTLDSMVGYKNQKYYHLGWASAKLDDLANFVPARLCAVLIPPAAALYNGNFQSSWKIMCRDRKNHASPNSAHPESAVAGALQIQLGGAGSYFGERVEKPTIGDPVRPLERNMITDALRFMYLTEGIAFVLGMGIYFLLAIYLP